MKDGALCKPLNNLATPLMLPATMKFDIKLVKVSIKTNKESQSNILHRSLSHHHQSHHTVTTVYPFPSYPHFQMSAPSLQSLLCQVESPLQEMV